MKNIVFLGAPGAGKGTQSEFIIKKYGIIQISTGDMLRAAVKAGSPLGKVAKEYMDNGKLVTDEIIIGLMKERLAQPDCKNGFILDGFPRTLNQAKSLDDMLVTLGVTNNIAVYLDIDLDEALKRVLGRITCPKCKRSYNKNIDKLMPVNGNICDDCKVELESRSDDNEETFKVRFNTYLENTSPIIDYYKEKGILKSFDVRREPNEICEDISKEANND